MAITDLIPWKRERETERHPLTAFQREMNRMFEDFFSGREREWMPSTREGRFTPTLDVAESDKEVTITVELPGLEAKDVGIELQGNTLLLSGEKKQESERKERDYYRLERSWGSFRRMVDLPAEVEADQADATFRNGVLKITVPKKAGLPGRKIEVKSA